MNNKAVENITKAFDDVVITPTLETISITADSFGIVDLKAIREYGFEVQSIYQKNGKVVIDLREQE